MSVGLVCPHCDALMALGATHCPGCNAAVATNGDATSQRGETKSASPREAKTSMKTCASCGNQVPIEDRFCGKCGSKAPEADAPSTAGKTMFFSGAQVPGRAKLVLIKGDSGEGLSYQLNGTEHVVGREEGAILFQEDALLSPRHANFMYRDGKLFVRDEGSTNGIFMRIAEPAAIDSGSLFLIGEQLLQVEASAPDFGPQPDAEGTYFYASPKRASKMRLIQKLRGGEIGLIVRARGESITIGREGNDVNFPDDPFISGQHAQVGIGADGRFTLVDCQSKNGTFVRITDEAPLAHGDYVFLGQQLLRVELP